ncbi:MAG: DUF6252 family protein [Bacteroidales bacterium]|nr:DUF6252 family protein [Bacteroidales bacterium]
MRLLRFILYSFIVFSFGIIGCRKGEISPDNFFETKINNSEKVFKPESATILKGITIIAAHDSKVNSKKAIIITVNGDKVGKYKQTFDYKTGVSVSQCSLSYKIISKEEESSPTFFTSYEGKVEITGLDRKNKLISGEYNFKLYSVPDDNKPYVIKGKFINLSYR